MPALALSAAILSLTAGSAQADTAPRVMRMTGEATVSAPADRAIIDIAVVTEAASAAQAVQQNAKLASQMMEKLTQQGVAKADMQTLAYQVNPFYTPEAPGKPSRLQGYRVDNTVQIKVHDINKTGLVLDAILSPGAANGIQSLRFEKADSQAQEEQAGRLAIRDALAKAKLYSEETKEPLGPIINLQESSAMPLQKRHMPMAAAMEMRASPATPIEGGDLTWHARVDVTFQLGTGK